MRVVIRVDASLKMGTGHVMRCLTLAEVLKENGADVEFICRKHEGNLINKIRSNGFNVFEFDLLAANKVDNKLFHSHWLGTTQLQDAIDCISVLQSAKADWLIVDHYGIDEDWQQDLKAYYDKLMVIDDLADRKHKCDILLDQTFGRQQQAYGELVPKSCELLLGSQFSLLRPEFAKWRQYSLERRKYPVFKQLLISMGGIDPDNFTEQVLKEVGTCVLPGDLEITIVMGGMSCHLESVKNSANSLSCKAEVRVDIDNMAEIMANTDIAIGAAGTTTWERCCLGLPTIQIVIADNQIDIARNLDSINAIQLINNPHQLSRNIDSMLQSIDKMSLVSSSLVDGKGSAKVAKFINSRENYVDSFFMRPAELIDTNFVYSMQTKEIRKYFIDPEIPSLDKHIKWFQNIINSLTSQLFILMLGALKIGVLRVDNIEGGELEISIIISPNYSGKGLAKQALQEIESLTPGRTLKAIIHNDNILSKGLFLQFGYRVSKQNGNFSEYRKNG